MSRESFYDWIRALITGVATLWLFFGTTDQLLATSIGYSCEEVKFYHHPLRAFFRQEGVRALSMFSFLFWGVWYPQIRQPWAACFGITVLAMVVSATYLLQTIIKTYDSNALALLQAMEFGHVALILSFGFSLAIKRGTLQRAIFWRIAGVVVATLPFLSMHYEGRYSYDLRDFMWSAKPFFLLWLSAAVFSNWRASVTPDAEVQS